MKMFRSIFYFLVIGRPSSPDDVPTKPNLPREDIESEGFDDATRPHYRWRYFFTLLLSLFFSGVTMSTIFLLLRQYQDLPISLWKQHISLNAAVAWLAAVAKLAMLIPLTECIGQAKWSLFSINRRKLSDLDLADKAGRDPIGALAWLFRFRGGIIVHFGAALVIASLGFDPALQHLIRYELNSTADPTQSAWIARNSDYSPAQGTGNELLLRTPQSILWETYSSVMGKPLEVDWSCPTGNCAIPDTTSVALCSVCDDITAGLQRNCKTLTEKNPYCIAEGSCFTSGEMCKYLQPATSIDVGGGNKFIDLSTEAVQFSRPRAGKVKVPAQIVNITALFLQPGSQDYLDREGRVESRFPVAPGYVPINGYHQAKAYSCAISFCEKHFHSSVTNGKLRESWSVAKDSQNEFEFDISDNIKDINNERELYAQKIRLTASPESTHTNVATVVALSRGFKVALTGNSSVLDTNTSTPSSPNSLFQRALYENLFDARFPAIIELMTTSATNAIRNTGSAPLGTGVVFNPVLHLRISWKWAALPSTTWVCVLLILLGVTANARKDNTPWLGTSQLAAAFIPLEQEVKTHVDKRDASWRDKAGMRIVAEAVKVRIAPKHSADGDAKLELTWLNTPTQ